MNRRVRPLIDELIDLQTTRRVVPETTFSVVLDPEGSGQVPEVSGQVPEGSGQVPKLVDPDFHNCMINGIGTSF